MCELRGIELPEEIIEVYRQVVLESHDCVVLSYAKYVDNEVLKGLRPVKQNVPQIKKRLVRQFSHSNKISADHLLTLQFYRPLEFFEDFSFSVIDGQLSNFCAIYGRSQVLASLLLDKRDRVQLLAENAIKGELNINEISGDEKNQFAAKAINFFTPFFDPLFKVVDVPKDEEAVEDGSALEIAQVPEKDDPRLRQKQEQIDALKKQVQQLKKSLKEAKKQAQQLDTVEKQKGKIEKENKKLKEDQQTLSAKLKEKEDEYTDLHAAIASTVDETLQSTLHHWIRTPLEIKKEAEAIKDLDHSDLAEKAEAVIRHQEELDRNAGNRRNLMERLGQLSALKEQVDALSIESINPVKELKAVREDLQKEISRIKKLIGVPPSDQLTRQFRVRIGTATTFDELSDCKRLLDEMQRMEMLPAADMKDLFVYCDARVSLMYDKHVPSISKAAAPVSSLYRLKQRLHDNTPVLWMLDGYNVLFQLPELFNTLDEDGKPTEASRRALSDKLEEMIKDAPNVTVQLYFDGPKYAEYNPAPNVKIIYSGGEGEHRADDAICRDLEKHDLNSPELTTVLTTDDWDLRQQAERLGANTVWVNEFYALVRTHDNGRSRDCMCQAVA